MVQIKLFNGNFDAYPVERDCNNWLKDHPNVHVIDIKFQQARYGDHSVCIIYEPEKQPF